MDFTDISDDPDFVTWLNRLRHADRAEDAHKGQPIRRHPNPSSLIKSFEETREQDKTLAEDKTKAIIVELRLPYAPSIHTVAELRPMFIAQMQLGVHHRGRYVVLRLVVQPTRKVSPMAVQSLVEDEKGTVVRLVLLYQQPENKVPLKEMMGKGSVCVLKEAYLKRSQKGSYFFRVDHVSDLVWLEGGDERIPGAWRKKPCPPRLDSKGIREKGNEASSGERWAEAHRCYSTAMRDAETPEDSQMAALNRSLANLKLGCPEEALQDTVRIRPSDPAVSVELRLFRESRALYQLGRFSQALAKLKTLARLDPENKLVGPESRRIEGRLQEQRAGEYSFESMLKQAKVFPPIIDVATFSRSVCVKASPRRGGKGLFLTKDVVAGELVLCEKAFAYSHLGPDNEWPRLQVLLNQLTEKVYAGGVAPLVAEVIQKLYHRSQHSEAFKDLSCDYPNIPVEDCDGFPVVDTFLVERILVLNASACPIATNAIFSTDPSARLAGRKRVGLQNCGVWLLASRINHGCVANCTRSYIGDVQIVRATTALRKGSELLSSYVSPFVMQSYEETQDELDRWNFHCECDLCERVRTADPDTTRLRQSIYDELQAGLASRNERLLLGKLKRLEDTYPRDQADSGLGMELSGLYFGLGSLHTALDKPFQAVEMIVKGLKCLGYDVEAGFPNRYGKKARLEVRRWGLAHETVPFAFSNIFKAYRKIGPAVCPKALEYLRMSYLMIVGEDWTADEHFPELQ